MVIPCIALPASSDGAESFTILTDPAQHPHPHKHSNGEAYFTARTQVLSPSSKCPDSIRSTEKPAEANIRLISRQPYSGSCSSSSSALTNPTRDSTCKIGFVHAAGVVKM